MLIGLLYLYVLNDSIDIYNLIELDKFIEIEISYIKYVSSYIYM